MSGVRYQFGTCANHPGMVGAWYEGNTYLCEDCSGQRPPALVQTLDKQSRRYIGMFVRFALDQLWSASPDSMGDDPTEEDKLDHLGCCPLCCAPCVALFGLLVSNELDAWVLLWPATLPGTSWWDEEIQKVDREWLSRAWEQAGRLGCHS
jgi:hypothetical protein